MNMTGHAQTPNVPHLTALEVEKGHRQHPFSPLILDGHTTARPNPDTASGPRKKHWARARRH